MSEVPAPAACFGGTCMCGFGCLYPAPTFADIQPAMTAMAEDGWTYDDLGRLRCPECSKTGPAFNPPRRPSPPPPQGDLFE